MRKSTKQNKKEYDYFTLSASSGTRTRGGCGNNQYQSGNVNVTEVPSAAEYADALGVDQRTVERWEKVRKKIISDPELLALSSTYEGFIEAKISLNQPSVYVFRMESVVTGELLEPSICKIGATLVDASGRAMPQFGYVARMEIVHECDDPFEMEEYLHNYFCEDRVDAGGKEWFKVTIDQVRQVIKQRRATWLI